MKLLEQQTHKPQASCSDRLSCWCVWVCVGVLAAWDVVLFVFVVFVAYVYLLPRNVLAVCVWT